jgi:hypothetical protein
MSAAFLIGDRVLLHAAPPYLKTADTMPMLRPGDLIPLNSQGVITAQKPGGYWTVKFDQGSFLVDEAYLEKVSFESRAPQSSDHE